ncbi:hypothetical protein DMB95_00080 [Campylobacter sp. MIT 12-8780]|uniref:hypothetical protein n=1 Tax=unclassified Campylobacter TaxID=2593542 RepID=UPI00115C7690|nr:MULTISPECIES: hypothetical protein [unclassified Campylobacter]NDJ26356.1 hypothetical protein [Campylobacter sp. MIT 19-121]TQR42933.1 hypothetical protein DMB95_00080 [Campylobacter sp. MIT 12-8780]
MKVYECIAHIRARLRDEEELKTRFSDTFLLDLLEFHQNRLLASFNRHILTQKFIINENENAFKLDFIPLKLISAFLNAKELLLLPKSFIKSHKARFAKALYEEARGLYKLSFHASGVLEINAIKKAFLRDLDDELVLDESFLNALIYSVLAEISSIDTHQNSTQKALFYKKLLSEELDTLRGEIASLSSNTSFKTPFIKV